MSQWWTRRLVGLVVVALAGAALSLQAAGLLRLAAAWWPPGPPGPQCRGVASNPGRSLASQPSPSAPGSPARPDGTAPWLERLQTLGALPGASLRRLPPPCSFGQVVLLAVSDDPRESMGGFRRAGHPTQLLRTGEGLAGYTVVALGWDRAWLAQGDDHCVMRLGASPQPPAASKGPTQGERGGHRLPPGKRSAGQLPPHLASLIEQRGQHQVTVDRRLVDKVLEDPVALLGGAAARPSSGVGGPQGLTLRRIRPGSLLHALGLRTGDRLVAINGLALDEPERLLRAYGALRGADHWSVVLQRGKGPVTLDIDTH